MLSKNGAFSNLQFARKIQEQCKLHTHPAVLLVLLVHKKKVYIFIPPDFNDLKAALHAVQFGCHCFAKHHNPTRNEWMRRQCGA